MGRCEIEHVLTICKCAILFLLFALWLCLSFVSGVQFLFIFYILCFEMFTSYTFCKSNLRIVVSVILLPCWLFWRSNFLSFRVAMFDRIRLKGHQKRWKTEKYLHLLLSEKSRFFFLKDTYKRRAWLESQWENERQYFVEKRCWLQPSLKLCWLLGSFYHPQSKDSW